MSKARTQPSPKTGLVFNISVALFLLLAIVLYVLNGYFKQEKWNLAQNQLRSQIVSTKTAVSGQLNQLKNILSSYETELVESKMNWVQLDPFFGIARAQKSGSRLRITQFIGRSGSMGDRWNSAYLEKALNIRKLRSDHPITVQLFRDKQGGKYIAISFANSKGSSTVVVGSADYFQKYFDLNRGGKMISLLKTTDQVLAAHSEADYVATLSDEASLSSKKYLIEKEEIAGTNLMAINYISKSGLTAGFVIPWSVVGLIVGFGFILVGLLFYNLNPIERKVERYRKQERDQIFKETLEQNLNVNSPLQGKSSTALTAAAATAPSFTAGVGKTGMDFEKNVKANKPTHKPSMPIEILTENKIEPVLDQTVKETNIRAPLQQALFNLDRTIKSAGITLEKHIDTNIIFDVHFAGIVRGFENILRNSIEAVREQSQRKIIIRAYDIEQHISVVEIKDTGVGLPANVDIEKLWQPFYTTKPKTDHMGLGLTEALSLFRQAGADLKIEKAEPEGVVVKMIIKKEAAIPLRNFEQEQSIDAETKTFTSPMKDEVTNALPMTAYSSFSEDLTVGSSDVEDSLTMEIDIDIDKALSLDDGDGEVAPEIKTAMTSKKFKTEPDVAAIKRPGFSMANKEFKVDEFAITMRKPQRSGPSK